MLNETQHATQLLFQKFPIVADRGLLRSPKIWSGISINRNRLISGTDGWDAAQVVTNILHAHPYISTISVVPISASETGGYYERSNVTEIKLPQRGNSQLFEDMNAALPQRSGWSQRRYALGMLSRMITDDGSIVHMPIVNFSADCSSGQMCDVVGRRDAVVLEQWPGISTYVGRWLIPDEKWKALLKSIYHRDDVDRFSIDYASSHAMVLRLSAILRW